VISLVVAVDRNGVIGAVNRLPWRLPDDLRRFKALTLGHPVIMGRKTYESIGRPLPGRRNLVVTRQRDYAAPGTTVAHSLQEAVALAGGRGDGGEIFVAGGASLYAQALPLADRLYVTHVETAVAGGDASFPEIDPAVWRAVAREGHPADARHAFPFSYVTYERVRGSATAAGTTEGAARSVAGAVPRAPAGAMGAGAA
jgi:dihydrofolate reductase